jgi:hypothetical protein
VAKSAPVAGFELNLLAESIGGSIRVEPSSDPNTRTRVWISGMISHHPMGQVSAFQMPGPGGSDAVSIVLAAWGNRGTITRQP